MTTTTGTYKCTTCGHILNVYEEPDLEIQKLRLENERMRTLLRKIAEAKED